FIFSGDFAQLPPVSSNPLYGQMPSISTRLDQRSINTALGLFYWHQVTTVVILKQNMRQINSGSADALFRTALQNMRTASCTAQDISFLKSRIVNTSADTYIAHNPVYRKASIIVARNLQKDRLNDLGVLRFASDANTVLADFYSLDREVCSTSGRRNVRRMPAKSMQRYLWNTYATNTGMIPGKLRLCYGLPVLIKHNIATELCITNGQEAEVVGWRSETMHHGLPVLDVVFVKLVNPPMPVILGTLPVNVVPITPINSVFSCTIADTDTRVTVDRYQIPILPNFAMTDFASQGKTRTPNVVDLTHCRSHQSFYTCLSRGTSAASTVILKDFKTSHITEGATGWLRQELRALDILDEITKRRYEGKLSATVAGTFRVPLIRSFR
ncbi:hypothetical protein AGABI2DRAFT_50525, partial [Agaricus bisporus var. bisporus H97]|uniref:hypothetical protein n=1 Tax=Agaricus bisporus var. bisporus (strain H97 / ATCC MYA-4626 / FGSC 10389) TaxID=936046 RepID=UPI00029F7C70